MTNLTSEQFRDILHNLENHTEETPNVQALLRRAVITFYERFGCYPELAGAAPGNIGLFGEQTQLDEGMAMPLATPLATVVVGRKVPGNRVTVVTSADVGKPHKVSFRLSECPLYPGYPKWINYIKGAMALYCCQENVPAFEMAVETSLPLGTGFGSGGALAVATYTFLELLVGKKVEEKYKANACRMAQQTYLNTTLGILDSLSSVMAKDRTAMLIDTGTHDTRWIPFRQPDVVFVAIDTHLQDTIYFEELEQRSKMLRKACDLMGVDTLRGLKEDDLNLLDERVSQALAPPSEGETGLQEDEWNEKTMDALKKKVRFYVSEMKRIDDAVEAWGQGDLETFGSKMTESHRSLVEDLEVSNPVLEFFVDTSLEVDGVLGSKMTGMGLNQGGGVITMMYKDSLRDYCEHVYEKYREKEGYLKKALNEHVATLNLDEFVGGAGAGADGAEGGPEEVGDVLDQDGKADDAAAPGGGDTEETEVLRDTKETADEEPVPKVKRKKKCDPSAKRKKKLEREEYLRLLRMMEEEDEEEDEEQEEGVEEARPEQEQFVREEFEPRGEAIEQSMGGLVVTRIAPGTAEEPRAPVPPAEPVPSVQVSERDPNAPVFYIVNPIAGARMMFVLKLDLLRSRYARKIPQVKTLVKAALDEFAASYDHAPEAIGVGPGTTTLFGEFLEYNLGHLIQMALPLVTVMAGGRNDTAAFIVKTLSDEVDDPYEFRAPVPSAGAMDIQPQSWINYTIGTVAEFKYHVPGFTGVVSSSVPCEMGFHSCSSFQSSIYQFLEGLTLTCTDPLEKAERCQRAESRLIREPVAFMSRCSSLRFIPTFLCKEGYVLFINSNNLKMAHYYLDHPAYAFMLACCKERSSTITVESLCESIKMCRQAAALIGKETLIHADERHLNCLRKRDAPEEMIKRAAYVISEQERCVKAVEAIKRADYEHLGLLMTQSHCSLRDDFEVSCPEVEVMVNLALSVDGVLGAKIVGKGLHSTVLILARITAVDKCIKHVRKNYHPKRDKPFFYVFRPSSGAYVMGLDEYAKIP